MKTVDAYQFRIDDSPDPPSGIEKAMVATVFFFASGLIDTSIAPNLGVLRVNDPFMIIAAGLGVSLQFTKFRNSFKTLNSRSLVLLGLLYGIVLISLFWTIAPTSGIARFAGFSLTTLWTLYAATRFSIRDLLEILIVTLLAVALVSTVLAVIAPSVGTMQVDAHKGDWKGIYPHKNIFGRNMALLVTVSLFCIFYCGPRRLGTVGFVFGLFVLVMSGSRTSLAVAAIGIVSILLLYFRRRPYLIAAITISVLIASLLAALQTIIEGNPLLELQGENLSIFQTQYHFTGRFGLWQFSLEHILKKPWFGYGYDGFWKIKSLGGQTLDEDGWQAQDSHNGFIDVLLQVGVVGMVIFLVIYAFFMFRAVRLLRQPRVAYADLFAGLHIFIFFFANLTESYALKATSIYQMLFTLSLVILCKKKAPRTDRLLRQEDMEPSAPDEPHQKSTFRSRTPVPMESGTPTVSPPSGGDNIRRSRNPFLRPTG